MKYDVVVDVTVQGAPCAKREFEVWDRFGTYTLNSAQNLGACQGTSRIYISPGCRAHLDSHLIISDISVKLETDLLHFEWRWDEVSLEGLDSDTISPQLALLEESGLFRPTLSDLHELNLHQRQSASWWTALVNFVGNLVMLVLFIGLVTFISVRLYRYRKSQKLSAIPQEE